ncbi:MULTISPECIES: DMT family transporter [Enterobacterales]|uniref:DMT family transporter n=1 Tax=Enterobacterales TaxID=91347 RepID=UPI002577F1B5|nr:DMT family transporter [Citrobacter sp. CK198]MDM2972137.1 DMT family transporter [Citrobacter sp. CK198]
MSLHSNASTRSQVGFFITLVASTFLMGSSFVAGKILLQQGFTPMILIGWRFFIAALATIPLILVGERKFVAALLPAKAGFRDFILVILIGLLQTAAVMGLLFWAMQFISASTAAILLFTNPIWVAVLGRIFLGESLHRARILGLLLGVAGVALAIGIKPSMFSGGTTLTGEIIGIVSALCWAAATLINKRAALPFGTWALSFWQMLIGAVAVLIIAYINGEHWPVVVTHEQWGWFLWLAIPASTGSFGLWFVALRKGGATRTSGFLFLAPLFTVILAYFILNASISWMQAIGGILIGLALWLVNREIPAKNQRERINEVLAEGEQ